MVVDDRPQIGHSRFSSFTKQFPAKFKKVVSRERVSSAHDVHDTKATTSSSNSYLSRFIPSRMRSPSQENGTASPSPHLSHAQHAQHAQHAHHHQQSHAHAHRRHQRRQSSPTPPSQHSHSSPSSEQQPSHHSSHHSHTHSPSAHHQRAFEVILGENRLLKNEVAMYKRSLSAATAEKDELLESYDALKSKVSDVTTQLRIMSRRYQKLRAKNDEYKKHLQNTLSARWQSQQDTIAQYHRQLSSIKAKYDILYAQYLEKNQLIAAWKHKHDRLAMDFDEFANDASASGAPSSRLSPSQLVRQCKDKDANLEALARIIRRMYAAAVPIIGEGDGDDDGDELEDELGHLDGERESEEDEEEDEQEALSVDDDDDALELEHRGQSGSATAVASLGVELATSTPPNSAMEFDDDEEDEDDDEAAESETSSEAPMTSRRADINGDARRSHSAAQSKQLEQLQRFLIHHSNGNGNGNAHGHGKGGASQAQSRSESIRSYATSHNLSAPPSKHSAAQRSNGRRLSQRTVSEESMRSINDDGIDERDDEPLPKPASSSATATVLGAMSSIVLPKAMPTLSGKTSSGSNRSAKMVSSPTASSVASACSAGSNKPKKRRRSWTTNGQIVVTTMANGQHCVTQTHTQPQTQPQTGKDAKQAKAKGKADVNSKEKEKNASSSSSESMDVAPSPAPPPPHPYILQTPQLTPQRAERDEQREIVVSDQLSTPSPNPAAHKFAKKRLGHYGHDDDEEDEDEQCTISE